MKSPVSLMISAVDVETLDLAVTARTVVAMMGKRETIEQFQQSVVVKIYGGEPSLPEISSFFRELDQYWPLWIHYLADESLPLIAQSLCGCDTADETNEAITEWLKESREMLAWFYESSDIAPETANQVVDNATAVLREAGLYRLQN